MIQLLIHDAHGGGCIGKSRSTPPNKEDVYLPGYFAASFNVRCKQIMPRAGVADAVVRPENWIHDTFVPAFCSRKWGRRHCDEDSLKKHGQKKGCSPANGNGNRRKFEGRLNASFPPVISLPEIEDGVYKSFKPFGSRDTLIECNEHAILSDNVRINNNLPQLWAIWQK